MHFVSNGDVMLLGQIKILEENRALWPFYKLNLCFLVTLSGHASIRDAIKLVSRPVASGGVRSAIFET